jgi:hypothetical protein
MTYNPMPEALDFVQWLTGTGLELTDALTKAAALLHVPRDALALAYQSTVTQAQLLDACIEALSLFDNYPQCYEAIGTYQVLQTAITNALKEKVTA